MMDDFVTENRRGEQARGHPAMSLWTKPITADGDTATVEQLTEAWEQWLAGGNMTFSRLKAELTRVGERSGKPFLRNYRIADRMVQEARKAGVIQTRAGRGGWELAP